MTTETINTVLDALANRTPKQAMSEHQLHLNGYHAAIMDVREALRRAADFIDDDGTLPDYIDVGEILPVRS